MGILTTKRTTMRKITISTLLTLLYLAGTAQALRAQQTTEDASLPADSV